MIFLLTFILLLIAVIDIFYPFYARKHLQFGISVPEPYVNEAVFSKARKTYSLIALIIHCAIIIVFLLFSLKLSADSIVVLFLILMVVMALASFTLYSIFHLRTKRLIIEKNWFEKVTIVHVTRFDSRLSEKVFSPFLFILSMVITVAIIVITLARYETIPDIIATHWGLDGEPDAWTEKSYITVIMLPVILLILQLVNLAIAYFVSKASVQLTAQSTDQSLEREVESRRQTQIFLIVTNISLTILLLFLHVSTTLVKITNVLYFIALFIGYLIVVTITMFVYAAKVYKKKEQFLTIESDESITTDDEFWKWGLFYVNKNDPAILVEKRVGIGWTFNFAHPGTYFFLFAVIILPLLPLFFL